MVEPMPHMTPIWKRLLPTLSRAERAKSKSVCAPPTMIASVPASAPTTPPETGASKTRSPLAVNASPVLAALDADCVQLMTTMALAGMSAAWFWVNKKSCAWSPETTMSQTNSASCTAPFASGDHCPPAASNAARLRVFRSKPVTACPACISRIAMGRPIAPRPIKAIRIP